jgi:hypothetical protein
LITLVNSGAGNLLGYLSTGAWFAACTNAGVTHWRLFWNGLAVAAAAVLVYFLAVYKGRARENS